MSVSDKSHRLYEATMHYLSTSCLFVVGLSVVLGCGDSGSSESNLVLIEWSAGDLDAYGCPYVEPVPWVSEETHEEVCGDGCEPLWLVEMFVACLSPEVGYPAVTVLDQATCMIHPVTGTVFPFSNTGGSVLESVCLQFCERDAEFSGILPDVCFEEVDPQ